jgi:hypothetical protein
MYVVYRYTSAMTAFRKHLSADLLRPVHVLWSGDRVDIAAEGNGEDNDVDDLGRVSND